VACKPGYQPFYDTTGIVSQCVLISNCKDISGSSTNKLIFSGCSECNDGYITRWDLNTMMPDYSTCVNNNLTTAQGT
jgi:hypothetical protein